MTPTPMETRRFPTGERRGFCACLRKSVHGDAHPLFRGRKCGKIKRYEEYNDDF